MDGTDEPDNLVRFSIREHYIAHLILTQMYAGREQYQMQWALFRLSGKPSNKLALTSREFEKSRNILHASLKGRKQAPEHVAKRTAQTTGEGNGMHHIHGRLHPWTGRTHTEESKNKNRESQLKRSTDPNYINPNEGKIMPPEYGENISKAKSGVYQCQDILTNTFTTDSVRNISTRLGVTPTAIYNAVKKGFIVNGTYTISRLSPEIVLSEKFIDARNKQKGTTRNHSEETKNTIRRHKMKKWIVTSPDGTVEEFKGAKEVAAHLGIGQWDVYNYSKSINTINGYTIRKS